MYSDLTNDDNKLSDVESISEPPKKKPKKQTSMGAYFKQIKIVTNKDGSKTQFQRQLDPLKEKPTVFDSKLICRGCHKTSFATLKGLRGHESCCKAAMVYELRKEIDDKLRYINESSELFIQGNVVNADYKAIARDQGNTEESNNSVLLSSDSSASNEADSFGNEQCSDGRKDNRGSSVRCRHTNLFNYKHFVACQYWIDAQKNEGKEQNVTDYCRNAFASNRVQYWCNNLSKWSKNSTVIIKAASDELYGPMLTIPSNKRTKSPVVEMESIMIINLKEYIMKGRKVSRRWICINAIKMQHDLDTKNKTSICKWFKASRG